MQAAGEQQERQCRIEKDPREMHAVERVAKPSHHVQMKQPVARDDEKRNSQRAERPADGRRQLYPEGINAADREREHEQDGEEVDRLKAGYHGLGSWGLAAVA